MEREREREREMRRKEEREGEREHSNTSVTHASSNRSALLFLLVVVHPLGLRLVKVQSYMEFANIVRGGWGDGGGKRLYNGYMIPAAYQTQITSNNTLNQNHIFMQSIHHNSW